MDQMPQQSTMQRRFQGIVQFEDWGRGSKLSSISSSYGAQAEMRRRRLLYRSVVAERVRYSGKKPVPLQLRYLTDGSMERDSEIIRLNRGAGPARIGPFWPSRRHMPDHERIKSLHQVFDYLDARWPRF
jgi:hypothetical protein